jgi:hypothetical protein
MFDRADHGAGSPHSATDSIPSSQHSESVFFAVKPTLEAANAVEGGQVTSQRGFTKSCIELDKSGNTAGLMITHLLDHTPTEVHVYWSLWAGLPIYVSTSAGPWSVDKGRIEFVQR